MKNKLRKEMKLKRSMLNVDEVTTMSRCIYENLFSLSCMKCAKTVCTFISAFKEPDTISIINTLWNEDVKVAVPISNVDTNTLTLSYIDSINDLKKGAYGILEPIRIKKADETEFEVILIPGLAFDKNGNRMGFGKGYYDRFLEKTSAVKIALCYSFQVVEHIPAEVHDVPMDYIITEKEIIKIR